MKPRLLVAVLSASVMAVASASAQASDILNTIELRRLVARGEPADHAQLRDHFQALARQFEADAGRQHARSRAAAGNPNRAWPKAPAHAGRLSEQTRQNARLAGDLAGYHAQRAADIAAPVPPGAARFHAGEGATVPTAAELRALAAAAHTPAEHRDLEEYFVTVAARHREIASKHVAMAQAYRANANRRTGSGNPAAHCERAIKSAREVERDALGHAEIHRALATVG